MRIEELVAVEHDAMEVEVQEGAKEGAKEDEEEDQGGELSSSTPLLNSERVPLPIRVIGLTTAPIKQRGVLNRAGQIQTAKLVDVMKGLEQTFHNGVIVAVSEDLIEHQQKQHQHHEHEEHQDLEQGQQQEQQQD